MKYLKYAAAVIVAIVIMANLDTVESMVRTILFLCVGILYTLNNISQRLEEQRQAQIRMFEHTNSLINPGREDLYE